MAKTIAVLPLLVCLIGLIVYLVSNSPTSSKVAEVGRIAYAFGLFFVLWQAEKIVALLTR